MAIKFVIKRAQYCKIWLAENINLELLMVHAYNLNVKDTPFAKDHKMVSRTIRTHLFYTLEIILFFKFMLRSVIDASVLSES